MTFTLEQTAALSAPLNSANVKSRSQAGRTLSYLEAWWAISEANRIFGFDGWTRETVDLIPLGEPRLVDGKWRVGYRAKVRIRVYTAMADGQQDSITREGCGFGSGIDKDVDQAHESALKEAESDAMKRALMTFGNPFGLALYDKTQANVTNAETASEPDRASGRLSAFEAKRQGIGDGIRVFIQGASKKELSLWMAAFDHNTAHVPLAWIEHIRDLCEGRLAELNAPVPAEVEEAAEGMDEAFRASVGPRSPAPVAGNDRQHQDAA